MSASDRSHDVEAMLNQLPRRQPSERLDGAIGNLFDSAMAHRKVGADPIESFDASLISDSSARFGWATLVATAIAAAIGGLLIGSTVVPGSANDISESTTALTAPITPVSNLTPVKFNLEAYELLHGHSTNPDFANCDSCHVDGHDEAFKGWFYGDGEFFKTHQDAVKSKKCASCHVNENQQDGQAKKANELKNEVKRLGLKHSDFPKTSCVTCHLAIDKQVKGAAPMGTEPKDAGHPRAVKGNDPFHHHFENVENCSNCHVGVQDGKKGSRPPKANGEFEQQKSIYGFQHDKVGDCKDCHVVQVKSNRLSERS